MGLGATLIARVEYLAETLAEYRQLDDKRRARICELERKLGDAERERDLARAEIMTCRVSDDSLRKERDHWKESRQQAIEAGELMRAEIESLKSQLAIAQIDRQVLTAEQQEGEAAWRQQLDAAQAEIETLRQQFGNAQRELSEQGLVHGVEGWQEAADLQKQLNAAQAALTRERLDAEERGRELERLREDHARLGRLVEERGQELETNHEDLTEARAEIETLREQFNADHTTILLQRAGIERLRAFVDLSRQLVSVHINYADVNRLLAALAELDAGTTEPTPVAETLDAEGGA